MNIRQRIKRSRIKDRRKLSRTILKDLGGYETLTFRMENDFVNTLSSICKTLGLGMNKVCEKALINFRNSQLTQEGDRKEDGPVFIPIDDEGTDPNTRAFLMVSSSSPSTAIVIAEPPTTVLKTKLELPESFSHVDYGQMYSKGP